jgi:hypothetical protein
VSGAETIVPLPQEATGLREQKIVSAGSFPAFQGEMITRSLRRGAERDGPPAPERGPFPWHPYCRIRCGIGQQGSVGRLRRARVVAAPLDGVRPGPSSEPPPG